MMRRVWIALLILLTGCTLSTRRDTANHTLRVVTATLRFTMDQIATPAAASPVPQIVILSTATPEPSESPTLEPTSTPTGTPTIGPGETPQAGATVEAMVEATLNVFSTGTAIVQAETAAASRTDTPTIPPSYTPPPSSTPTLTASPVMPPTFTPLPTAIPPTRTRPGPPTVPPLDDGSGNIVPGTGSSGAAVSPVVGVDALPETLYFLSDQGSVQQVWRLRIGFSFPDQLTFSPNGVAAFDVSPDGTLAYITPSGDMIIGGIPFLPPAAPDGTFPQVSALAWSPGGDWLAYTLQAPGAEGVEGGQNDGLWIRNAQGTTVLLEANTYGSPQRIYGGRLDWRPDGSEVLVKTLLETGSAYSRVNITTGAVSPVWNAFTLPPDAYASARWNINGNAIIVSGAGTVLRVEPDTLAVQTIPGTDTGLNPQGAQQFANGTVTFVGGTDAKQLYVIPLAQGAPTPVTRSLTTTGGRVDFAWDNVGQQTLVVVYEPADSPLGTPYLRDEMNNLYDLTALTGLMGSPQWGPTFRSGDLARVHTTEGDTLNVRAAPGGNVLIALVNGSRVTITGGPRLYDGLRWWRIQTPDGLSGWAVEAVTDERGERLRTLIPAAN
jgi:hypothetical protein